MRLKRYILPSLVGLIVVAGVTGAYASSRDLVTANDVLKNSSANINLSETGGVRVTVVSESVPAGTWILSATATVVNFGPSDYTRCEITKGNTHLVQGTTMVGNSDLPGNMGPGAYVASVSAIGTVTSASNFTAKLRCFHDTTTPSGNSPPYVDSDAALWAHLSP